MAKKNFMGMMKDKTSNLVPSLLSSEEAIKSNIIILDELKEFIPPLAGDELTQLEKNLIQFGVKDPLTVWETKNHLIDPNSTSPEQDCYVLLDGHNRFGIIQKYGLDFRINLMSFDSIALVKEYMIDYQLGRRNLTPEQASFLRGKRYLQQKQERGGYRVGQETIDVSEELGKTYGVSGRTIKRDAEYTTGLEKLSPELRRDVLSGQQKIAKTTITELGKNTAIEAINSLDEIVDITLDKTPLNSASKKEKLEEKIKNLASGNLTKSTLEKLLNTVNQLLTEINLSK